jgi:hypothetical protein
MRLQDPVGFATGLAQTLLSFRQRGKSIDGAIASFVEYLYALA